MTVTFPRTRGQTAILLLLAACGRGRSALVENGGFEDGLAGWTAEGGVVADAPGAHGGRTCAGGAVAGKGWTLAQAGLPVTKGRTYRVDAWVRANGAASLALWTQEKGPKDAQRAAVWEDVGADWTPVAAFVTAARNEKLTLRFAAKADGDEAASVFLDDVAVTEATLPVATQVEPGKGFDDEPSMARAADGSLYVAWLSWRDGADSLQTARFAAKPDGTFEKLGTWQVEGGARSVFSPQLRVSPQGHGPALDYVAESQGHWCNAGCVLGPDGPPSSRAEVARSGPPLTDRPHLPPWDPDVRLDVDARRISDGIEIAVLTPRSPLPNVHVVTQAPTIDRNPILVSGAGESWVLYENVETPGYRVSFETARHVVVARIDGDRLVAPKNYIATSPLWSRAESPAAAFDAKGRLWVAYRKPRLPTAGWDVFLTGWTGNAWVPPIPVSSRKGMNRRPGLVIDGDRAIVCYQADDLPEGWGDIDRAKDATSGVYLVSVPLPDVPAAPHELEPLVENPAPWEAAEIRRRFGDEAPVPHETDVGGEKLKLLVGDLHSHSDTSICERLTNGSADDVYAMQRDFLHLDFACLTDHGEDFNPYLWNRQAKLARANEVPGKFTTFLGEEWTSSFEETDAKHPYGFYGHRNLILADLRFPRWWNPRNRQTPAELWADLRAAGANFVTIPHQLADTGNVPTDWSFADEVAQPVAEVFQIRGSYEGKDAPRVAKKVTPDEGWFLQDALRRGVVTGVIASPDHGGGVGKACVWAKENSREAILDALRARRCYGTTGARIALEVRVGGHFMGEKTSDGASGPVTIEVRASCPNDVAKVSICRGGAWIREETPTARDFAVRFTDDAAPAGPKWYYVRVEQKDGEIAWSSPVWLGAAK